MAGRRSGSREPTPTGQGLHHVQFGLLAQGVVKVGLAGE
jgi:hypothetical protein